MTSKQKQVNQERNFIDSISDFVNINSKHGYEVVVVGLANIVAIFLMFIGNQNPYLIWAIFGFIIIEVIIVSIIYYKKEMYKLKNG